MKKVYIESNGCAVLRHETYKLAKYLEENGFKEIDNPKDADFIIMTGCGVLDINEDFAIESIKRLYKNNTNNATIIVSGCIPTISKEKIKKISKNIIQIRNDEMYKFDEYFYTKKRIEDVYFNINPKRHHSFGDPGVVVSQEEEDDLKFVETIDKLCKNTRATDQFIYSTRGRHLWREKDLFEIRVAYGCASKCSYCITRIAIGDFKSVPKNRIIEQVKKSKKEGYKRIMLMGDEIGAWQEGKENICDLVKAIVDIIPDVKLGIRYIHPNILVKYYEKLRPYFANGNIYYFCAAFQSGSKRILKLMDRNPDIESFIKCMEDIEKNKYPVFRHTQIIVGFPTETEYDLLKTLDALQRSSFDHVTISAYSKRKGTKASALKELPKKVIDERMEILNNWLKLNRDSRIYNKVKEEVNNKKGEEKI